MAAGLGVSVSDITPTLCENVQTTIGENVCGADFLPKLPNQNKTSAQFRKVCGSGRREWAGRGRARSTRPVSKRVKPARC